MRGFLIGVTGGTLLFKKSEIFLADLVFLRIFIYNQQGFQQGILGVLPAEAGAPLLREEGGKGI